MLKLIPGKLYKTLVALNVYNLPHRRPTDYDGKHDPYFEDCVRPKLIFIPLAKGTVLFLAGIDNVHADPSNINNTSVEGILSYHFLFGAQSVWFDHQQFDEHQQEFYTTEDARRLSLDNFFEPATKQQQQQQ